MKVAMSTLACPTWPLDEIVGAAGQWDFEGIELRTDGPAATRFASDPALVSYSKIREMCLGQGLTPVCVATPFRFDAAINPPVIGRVISDNELAVRRSKWAADLASAIDAPFIRVFGFEGPRGERRSRLLDRVVERLNAVIDHCRNTGVRPLLENGGSFVSAASLREVISTCRYGLLGASYSVAPAWKSGLDPVSEIGELGSDLEIVKLKDWKNDRPCPIGEGDVPCQAVVETLMERGFKGWLVIEWDAAWWNDLAPGEEVLPAALERVESWAGSAVSS